MSNISWLIDLPVQIQSALIALISSIIIALIVSFINPFSQKRIDRFKNEMQIKLESQKKDISLEVDERSAQRDYEYEARKRLYLAIGPLRLQLLFACRDCAGRIRHLPKDGGYTLTMDRYFGRSTVYRILRPLAILELIERQVSTQDFSFDKSAIDYFRLNHSLNRHLNGSDIALSYPEIDWTTQKQHVFTGSIIRSSNAIIHKKNQTLEEVIRFDEFDAMVDDCFLEKISPFPNMINNFRPDSSPLLWVRLVAFGFSCNSFVEKHGEPLGFAKRTFSVRNLLLACPDEHVRKNIDDYVKVIESNALMEL